ncbi:MAG TPA: hypothetical protein VNM22_00795 [Candidatus Limnocylindrales bacterium]|nr:hypothetical protein [Candidatus Limnocylindrales bacterium]
MTVNQTSSTSGDGDRDELYFKVARLGPGTQSSEKRLPVRMITMKPRMERLSTPTVGPTGMRPMSTT